MSKKTLNSLAELVENDDNIDDPKSEDVELKNNKVEDIQLEDPIKLHEEKVIISGNEIEIINLRKWTSDQSNREKSSIQILNLSKFPNLNPNQLMFSFPDPVKDNPENRSLQLIENPDSILTLNNENGFLKVLGTKTLMFIYFLENIKIFVYNASQAPTSSVIICGKDTDIPLYMDKITNKKNSIKVPIINEDKLKGLLSKDIKQTDKDDVWLKFTKGGPEAKSLKEKYEKEIKTYEDLANYFLELKKLTIDVAYLLKLDSTLIHAFTK